MLVSRVENNSEGGICSVNILGDIKSGVALDKSNGSHILFDTPDILLINANRKMCCSIRLRTLLLLVFTSSPAALASSGKKQVDVITVVEKFIQGSMKEATDD